MLGKFGNALKFDGVGDYSAVLLPASMKNPSIALSAWIKKSPVSNGGMIVSLEPAGANSVGLGAHIGIRNNAPYFSKGSGDGSWEVASFRIVEQHSCVAARGIYY